MISFEVTVPDHGSEEPRRVDGVAIDLVREKVNPILTVTMVAVIVDDRLEWFGASEVEWGAPRPVDTRPL